MAKQKPTHNALSQKIGDVYHYYIAIKFMFENNTWSKCTIEESGDIALYNEDGTQLYNIEVKHHLSEEELKIYEVEFQKTLYNWFNIKNQFTDSTTLILFTTANLSSDNILKNWNEFDSDKKYKELNDNSKKPNDDYYTNVEKYFLPISKDIKLLKQLLEKIILNTSSPVISYIKSDIKSNTFFNIFRKEAHKNEVISSLYGLIGDGLISATTWEITKIEFNQKLIELTTLVQNKTLRTDDDVTIDDIDTRVTIYHEKQFIKKLVNIKFEDDILQLAIDDYAKTIIEVSKRLELTQSIEYHNRLENYENTLINKVTEIKTKHKYKSGIPDIVKSQNSYFAVMDSNKIPFMSQEFDDQTTFFQKGYFHVLADDEENPHQICWSLKPEDLI